MADEDGNRPLAAVRRRYGAFYEWLVLDGDRRTVAAVVLLTGFVLIGPIGGFVAYGVIPTARDPIADRHTTVPLVAALLSGNFLLFSIVVSVNSLFASQEQSPLGQQYGRIQSVVEFRRSLEDVVGTDHVPAQSGAMVRLLSGEIVQRAQEIQEGVLAADFELRADLDSYVESLAEESGEMNERARDAETTFEVMRAVMGFNHDRQINDLRRLRSEHRENLTEETEEELAEMLRLLQYFATAREYFKTLYMRQEFADLSHDMVLTMVPTAAVLATSLHYLTAIPDTQLLIAAIEAVAFVPFVLVASYVIRVAVVSKRTQAAGQFVAEHHDGDVGGIPRESD